MAKWIAAEKARAGLRQACDGKDQGKDNQSKRARAGSLAIVDWPQVARTCTLRADVVLSFFYVTVLLFYLYFVFVFFAFT